MIKRSIDLGRRFIAIAAPYWLSEKKWTAWGLLGLLVVVMLVQVYSEVLFNQQTGELTSALAAKDPARFWRTIYECLAMLVIAVPVWAAYPFIRDKLGIHWRRWLTRSMLDRYLGNRAYYELNGDDKIDNPDQRIAEDVSAFTQRSLYYLLIILWSPIQVLAFSGVLWNISRPLVCFLMLYAIVGTFVTTVLFGRVLIGLNFLQIKKEADFRFGLVRIRENAESIALYRGEAQELAQVDQRFESVYETNTKLINRQFLLNTFGYAYKFLAIVIPYGIIASRVLTGELEVGVAIQAAGAFTAILTALAIIIDNFDGLSRFVAGIDRLETFVKFLDEELPQRAANRRIQVVRGEQLAISRLSLRTPDDRRWIVSGLSTVVRPGEGLMIVGPSGSGKSSLLRAIAGLASAGRGTIVRPELKEMLFLPQRPYMILGSLRDQLLYPLAQRYYFDEELLDILERVNLGRLASQFGGLDAEADWEKVLSVGEQQRLAFARLFIAQPKYAMLDEATSALDARNEEWLYELLSTTATTFVSVSHHDSLQKFHSSVLEIFGDGRWQLHSAGRFSSAGAGLASATGVTHFSTAMSQSS
jgi:vitamin B12/bleomycin/antimicrobial peptide transport system ATP-binding/permease protein